MQCVSGIVARAVERVRREMLPGFPHVDDVIALDHTYGCGVAIDAPGAAIPIRTLHNVARNPNFAGSTMVVSLGCEKLRPSRLFPEAFGDPAGASESVDLPASLITLQDEIHVGFDAVIASTLRTAERLGLRNRLALFSPGPVTWLPPPLRFRRGAANEGFPAADRIRMVCLLLFRFPDGRLA